MKLICGEIVEGKGALALLALRMAAGPAFILHGWGKVQHATSWMGEGLPAAVQAMVAFGEFAAGIAFLVGFLTPLAGLGMIPIMLGAILLVHIPKGDPFVGGGGSWELAAVYLAVSVALMLRGAGAYSIDAYLNKKK